LGGDGRLVDVIVMGTVTGCNDEVEVVSVEPRREEVGRDDWSGCSCVRESSAKKDRKELTNVVSWSRESGGQFYGSDSEAFSKGEKLVESRGAREYKEDGV
jgi:hypothetical protein